MSVGLIALLFYSMRGEYGQISAAIKNMNLTVFLAAFLLFILAVVLASVRMKLIIEAQEIPLKVREAVYLNFIGYFFNNFLPTTIGGDVVKAYYLAKGRQEKMGSFTSIFVDRVIGLLTMILMAFVALFFASEKTVDNSVKYSIFVITALSFIIIILMFNKNFAKKFKFLLIFMKPIEDKIRRAYDVIHKYQHHKMLLFQSFVISIISQLFFFGSLAVLALSIGFRVPFMEILLRMPIVGTISLLPSINGLGLREGSTVVLFGPIMGKENAFVVSILWLLMLFIISIIGGLVYGIGNHFNYKVKISEEPV